MKRKLISSLLCLCMLISLIPVAAFAQEGDGTGTATPTEGQQTATAAIGDLQFFADGAKANAAVGNNKTDSERDTMIVPYSGLTKDTTYALTLVYPTAASHTMSGEAITPTANGDKEELINEWKAANTDGKYYFTLNPWKDGKQQYKGLAADKYTVKLYTVETATTETKQGETTTPAKTYKLVTSKEITLAEVTVDFGTGKTANDLITQHEVKDTEKFFTIDQTAASKVKFYVNAADIATVTDADATLKKLITPTGVAANMEWTYANDTKTFTGTLPTPAITITTAPLHDTSDRVANNDLCTGYSVTQPDAQGKITVSASNVRLHKNADTSPAYGYWTGVQFKAPAGYTVKYKGLDNASTEWATDVENGAYVSLYNDFESKKTRTITIGLFMSDTLVAGTEKTYTIDFSGVTKKASTATLHYTAVADKNVVSDCAPETIWAEFDEPLRPGWLWFDITDPTGVRYGIAGSSAELNNGKLPTKQAWSFQNKGQFEAWPKNADNEDVAPGVKTGEYTVVGYYVGDTKPTQRPTNLSSLTKIVDGKVAVVAPVEDVEVVAPAAPKVEVTGVDQEDVQTVTNALKNVAPTEDSVGVLQNAANTSANTTSTKPAYSKDTAASELNNKLDDVNNATAEDVSIVYQPYMDVKATAYNGTAKTLTVDITPKCHVLATTEDLSENPELTFGETTGNNAVKLGDEPLTVTTPIEMQIGLPAGFASNGGTVYVQHKGYEYDADVTTESTDLIATFVNPHGFSTFTVTATPQTVATIGNTSYTTLKAAVEAAKDGDTITLVKAPESTTITANIPDDMTIDFVGFGTATTVTINGEEVAIPASGTVTKSFGEYTVPDPDDGNHSGGGGGVSSNVTIDRPTNGKVSVTPTAPSKGATVTINLTPDTGYAVGTVTVTDKDGKAVELTKVSDTKYTFTMPDGKVKVAATFTKVDTPPATGFTDVPADAYYADAVKWAVDKGITNGLTDTTFGPNNSCTRGQMVTFLWRAAGSPAATGTNSFTDVDSSAYYYNAVLWAVEKNITNGTTSTTFSPNATVNRGQTVTFLYRYAESPAATGDTSFTDVAADAYYADAVKWAVAEEITNGTSSTTFSPASNCTRGQIVTFLYRQMAE